MSTHHHALGKCTRSEACESSGSKAAPTHSGNMRQPLVETLVDDLYRLLRYAGIGGNIGGEEVAEAKRRGVSAKRS